MLWGGPWTSRWGGNEEQIKRLELKEVIGGVRIRASMIDGYTQFCRVVIDGINCLMKKVYDGDELTEFVVAWPKPSGSVSPALTAHMISLVPMGDGALPNFDATYQQIIYNLVKPERIAIQIAAVPSYFCYHGAGTITDLASWSLSGLKRFQNCKPVRNRKTWGAITWTLTSIGTVHTLTLSVDGIAVASGSRTGNGSITLTELNSSGLSGTVVYTDIIGDITDGILIARFPAQYKIHHRTSGAFAPIDFPRTAEQTLYDDGRKTSFLWSSAKLGAGTHYVVVHQVDEDGNESSGTVNSTIVLYAEPEAAGTPASQGGTSDDGRTNLCIWSEAFNSATWVKTRTTITADSTVAPDGNTTADTLKETATNGTHSAARTAIVGLSGVTNYCASVYVKAGARTKVRLEFTNQAVTVGAFADFDLTLGTMYASGVLGAGTFTAAKITSLANGWYRIEVSGKMGSGTGGISVLILDATGATSYVGVVANDLYLWGAQVELGTAATPYIPTAGAQISAGTFILFAASATVAATYNIYDTLETGILDMDNPSVTHIAGSGFIWQKLAALSVGYTGTRNVVVKSLDAGVESKAIAEITIEYVAGVVQENLLPPEPTVIERNVTIAGRTISVPCNFLVIEQLAAATKIKLWITPVGTPVDFTLAPDGTVTLAARVGKSVDATVSGTAGADGAYNVAIRTETAAGVRSTNTDEHGPYELTVGAYPDPVIELRGGPA